MTRNSNDNPFVLRERRPPSPGDSSWQPKSIRQWISTLPKANAAVTAFELQTKLEVLNALEFPVDDRYRVLERLFDTLRGVLRSLTKIYISESLPLSPRAQEALFSLRGLCAATVIGYKVILQQTRGDSLFNRVRRKRARAIAMHRMIYSVGRMLLADYHLYQSCSKHLWREIHRIYRYAVEWELHRLQVPDEDPLLCEKTSVEDKYKQLLLLASASPYRLSPGEVDRVYIALQRWAPLCRISNPCAGYPDGAVIYVDSHSDHSPVYLGADEIRPDIGLIVDPGPMADGLAGYLESNDNADARAVSAVRPNDEPGSLPAGLLRRLMLSWGFEAKREDGREAITGEVLVTRGLDDFYRLLGGAIPGGEEIEQILITSNNGAEAWNIDAKGEPWRANSRAEIESIALQDDGKASWSSLQKKADVSVGLCKICNKSEGGYHLRWQGDNNLKLRVGELVGVNEDVQSPLKVGWRAGVVRWFRASPSAKFECGIQIFDEDVCPAMIYRKRRNSPYEEQWLGLLMSPECAGKESLIAPSFYAEEGEEIRLVRGGEEDVIVPEQVVECSGSFVQFKFSVPDMDDPDSTDGGERGESQRIGP